MRKRMIKKLYTLYPVIGDCDTIRKDPNHKFVSYSGGKASCIKYHDSLADWLNEIKNSNFKNGFGIRLLTYDEESYVDTGNLNLECSIYYCEKYSDDVVNKLANIIDCYYMDPYYYEIKEDNIWMIKEYTGHMYYGSSYESCDGCGNCNGANCDYCNKKYTVKDLHTDHIYYSGFNKDKADKVYNKKQKHYKRIIRNIIHKYNISGNEEEIACADYKSVLKILRDNKIPYAIYSK